MQGDRGESVLLILRGRAKVLVSDADGRDHMLGIRGLGDIVGELAFLDGRQRSASVLAQGRLTASTIPRARFADFLSRHAVASIVLAALVARRLRISDERRIESASYDVPTRIARVLRELVVHDGAWGTDAEIRVSQAELAQLVGAAEVTVHRAVRDLREAGLIRCGYRKLVVLDFAGLTRLASLPPESIARWDERLADTRT